jgi:LPS-assembly lipoprotein
MHRRQFHARLGALGLLALGGCGFAPRQIPDMPFKTLAFSGFALQAPMEDELRLLINGSRRTRVIDSLTQADAILDVLIDSQERGKGAVTTAGQIRAIFLTYRFKFQVRTLAGKELLGPTELVAIRGMSYNESQALGKEKEELSIYQAMRTDLADQVMRRLAAVKVPLT